MFHDPVLSQLHSTSIHVSSGPIMNKQFNFLFLYRQLIHRHEVQDKSKVKIPLNMIGINKRNNNKGEKKLITSRKSNTLRH